MVKKEKGRKTERKLPVCHVNAIQSPAKFYVCPKGKPSRLKRKAAEKM